MPTITLIHENTKKIIRSVMKKDDKGKDITDKE